LSVASSPNESIAHCQFNIEKEEEEAAAADFAFKSLLLCAQASSRRESKQ
jgi:hypothetical protein